MPAAIVVAVRRIVGRSGTLVAVPRLWRWVARQLYL